MIDFVPEDHLSVAYFYTVTLKPSCYKEDSLIQFNKYKTHLNVLLELLPANNFHTSIAEVTQSQNIHFHGVIKFVKLKMSPQKMWFDALRKSKYFGFSSISQVENWDKTIEYLKKDFKETQKHVGLIHPPIISDGLRVFTPECKGDWCIYNRCYCDNQASEVKMLSEWPRGPRK